MTLTKAFRQRLYVGFVLALLGLRLFFWLSPEHQQKMVPAYLWPCAVAALALLLWQRWGSLPRPALASLGLAGWFGLTCVLNGDRYFSVNLQFTYGVLVSFGLCFPLFLLVDGDARARGLKRIGLCYAVAMTGFSLLCVYAFSAGQTIASPFSGSVIGMREYRLWIFDNYPNEVACALSIAVFLWIALAFDAKRPAGKLACALCALAVSVALILTVCRTVAITVALGMGVAAFLAVTRALRARKPLLRYGAGATALMLATLLAAGVLLGKLLDVPSLLTSGASGALPAAVAEEQRESGGPAPQTAPEDRQYRERELSENFLTFSFRTEIWRAGLQYLMDRPVTLLLGSMDSEVARVPMRYLPRTIYHMHNSWLEMLLLTGVPGLLCYLYLMVKVLIAAFRCFFREQNGLALRFFAVIPPLLLINGLMEIYPCVSGNVMDMMFLLLCGALIGLDAQTRGKPPARNAEGSAVK